MRILVLILMAMSSSFQYLAQSDNVACLDLPQPDERLFISMHYNRSIGLGTQYVGVKIINRSTQKLRVELSYYADLTCGERVSAKIGFGSGLTIEPGDTIKPGGFFDSDNSSFDAAGRRSSTCLASPERSRKLNEDSYTCIQGVGFTLINITVVGNGSNNTNSTSGNSNNSSSTTSNGESHTTNDNQEVQPNSTCPPQDFGLLTQPGESCAHFVWMSGATNAIDANGNLIQHGNYPDQFIFQYKKQSELIWKENKVDGYKFQYILSGLEPRVTYEARLARDCGNFVYSVFSPTLTFTTQCPKPYIFRISEVTKTTANITCMKTFVTPSSPSDEATPDVILEYREIHSDNWVVKHYEQGTGGGKLTDLKPNMTYYVRLKFIYANGKESEYSDQDFFQTWQ